MAFTMTAGSLPAAAIPAQPRLAALRHAMLWLIGVSGAVVFIEPSPYEFATLLALVVFVATGLRLRAVFMPLILMLVVNNIGYSIGAIGLTGQTRILIWVLTSWYMAVTAVMFAMVLAEDTAARFDALARGMILGALIAATAGILGYFNIVGHDIFTRYGRASGTFKDPNVLSAYLVLPALLALQSVVADPLRKAVRSSVVLVVLSIGVLLAFSRGAWGLLIFSSSLMLVLMTLTSRTAAQRRRIITTTLVALAAIAVVIAILLSFDQVQELFRQRASLTQSYDSGRFGRFGRHVLGAILALDVPLGLGPLQFNNVFPEDPHNSYLNAFMSGGWLSGVTYPALIFTTLILGARYLFARTPWQRPYLAVFATYVGIVIENFIIDTDHWRHFFLLIGAVWGMAVATHNHVVRERTAAAAAQAGGAGHGR